MHADYLRLKVNTGDRTVELGIGDVFVSYNGVRSRMTVSFHTFSIKCDGNKVSLRGKPVGKALTYATHGLFDFIKANLDGKISKKSGRDLLVVAEAVTRAIGKDDDIFNMYFGIKN